MSVTAWTKIGDRIEALGKWAVIQLLPYRGAMMPAPKVQPFEDSARAQKVYREKSENHRKGGIFLVNPEGVVTACLWVAPNG